MLHVAATKTALDKINMRVFPPVCLRQHCRVGLGTDSTQDKREVKVKCLSHKEWRVAGPFAHVCCLHCDSWQWAVPMSGSLDPQ